MARISHVQADIGTSPTCAAERAFRNARGRSLSIPESGSGSYSAHQLRSWESRPSPSSGATDQHEPRMRRALAPRSRPSLPDLNPLPPRKSPRSKTPAQNAPEDFRRSLLAVGRAGGFRAWGTGSRDMPGSGAALRGRRTTEARDHDPDRDLPRASLSRQHVSSFREHGARSKQHEHAAIAARSP